MRDGRRGTGEIDRIAGGGMYWERITDLLTIHLPATISGHQEKTKIQGQQARSDRRRVVIDSDTEVWLIRATTTLSSTP